MMSRAENILLELRSERQGAECPEAAVGQVDCGEGSKPFIWPTDEDTEL